jgi:hypothetical protein
VTVGLWLTAGERAAWTILALAGRSVVEPVRVLLRTASLLLSPGVPLGAGSEAALNGLSPLPLGVSVWDGYAVSRRGPPRAPAA